MTHTVHLQFEEIDNTVLQRLCGALDSNLETLGKALDIQISRRFEHFTFMGETGTRRPPCLAVACRSRRKRRLGRQRHQPSGR